MSVDDTQEKLWQAVQTALVGAGNIQERLRSAAMYLIRVQATESAFPARADLQRRLEAILRELTGSPATGRGGTLESSIAALKDAMRQPSQPPQCQSNSACDNQSC